MMMGDLNVEFCEHPCLYWEKASGKTISFGKLTSCLNYYGTEFSEDDCIDHEMSNLILPPSPSWFQHNGVSTRLKDRLFTVSCFKNIVVFKLPEGKGTPKVMKLISHIPGKVNGVAIYPDNLNHEFGHTVGVIGDQNTLSLFDLHTGSLLAQQKTQNTPNSLCWGYVREEDVIVAVGEKGSLVIWQPKYLVERTIILEPKRNLNVVEIVPQERNKALVASDRTILLVCLESGNILCQYKGHDHTVYSIRFYPGTKNLWELGALPTNTRWKVDEPPKESMSQNGEGTLVQGPFFATSDVGRGIIIWDLSARRFLTKAVAPHSSNFKKFRGGSQARNNHIAINWSEDKLYSSTIVGEILEWNLMLPDMKYKLISHIHSRVIYNMEMIENQLITFGQDRLIVGFDLNSSSKSFLMGTMGVCANSMAYSPHDASRLAIGMQDEMIKLVTLNNSNCHKIQNISQNIKGKVLSLAWHPIQEGKLLFGTSDGQVGIADIFSNTTSTFAYFHQKPTYKVEWGKPFAPEKTGLKEDWYAYSFGDRELVAHNPMRVMEDPTWLDKLLGMERGISSTFLLSEFSFSSDYKYVALGSINGDIKVFDRLTANCVVVIARVRKVIQHILWKPPSIKGSSYTIGVASAENSIYIFNLDTVLKESESSGEAVNLMQPSKELCAHAGRVIWLSWSLHEDGLLASSSYDHTVQIWNTNTSEPVKNYGGHTHRVFRCEFSPSEPDTVISFAEESCIHSWKISQLTARMSSESAAILKEYKKKSKINMAEESHDQTTDSKKPEQPQQSGGKAKVSAESSTGNLKKLSRKSFFPLFHNNSSRKKNFHHMCLLSLMESKLASKDQKNHSEKSQDLSEELEDEDELLSNSEVNGIGNENEMEKHVVNAMSKYGNLMPTESPLPQVEDVVNFLSYFGSVPQVDAMVNEEIKNHEANENFEHSNFMSCWRGSLESRIKYAAKHKRLDPFLVSLAPQVSFSLWEYACESYAEQLVENGEPVVAATYLISIHKDEAAVDLLLQHKQYREALTIAKYRLGFNNDVIEKVLCSWANTCVFEGNFELAAILQYTLGNPEQAARTLARRTECRSLIVAAQLFLSSNCFELATSTAILAFKGASSKNEFEKFEPILKQMPHLLWCKVINIAQEIIWNRINIFKEALTFMHNEYSQPKTSEPVESSRVSHQDKCDDSLIKSIISQWEEIGVVPSNYRKYSKEIKENMTTQSPVSLKSLWFFTSVSLTEMLLDGLCEGEGEGRWEDALDSILKQLAFWDKIDQTFYFTHILLPKGIFDLSQLLIPTADDRKNHSTLKQLRIQYIISEVSVLLSVLENDHSFVPWKREREIDNETSELLKGKSERVNVEVQTNGETTEASGESETEVKEEQHTNTPRNNMPKDTNLSEVYDCDNANVWCLYQSKEHWISTVEKYIEELQTECQQKEEIKLLIKLLCNLKESSAICSKVYTALLAKTESISSA